MLNDYTSLKSIRDNFFNSKVGEVLKDKIQNDDSLSFVSVYFAIYAYESLNTELDRLENVRIFLTEELIYTATTIARFNIILNLRMMKYHQLKNFIHY